MYDQLINDIQATFLNTKSIILWGSAAREGFNPDYGDKDILIITSGDIDNEKEVESKLEMLRNKYKDHMTVDPCLTTIEHLKTDMLLIFPYGARTVHVIEQYQFTHESTILYGDPTVLESIPKITLEQALHGILPYVLNKVIPKLREESVNSEDLPNTLQENKDKLILLAREIYTIDTKKIALKLESLHYIEEKYPDLKSVAQYLITLYKGIDLPRPLKREDVLNLLNTTEIKIRGYIEN
jgi:hypothetical protein